MSIIDDISKKIIESRMIKTYITNFILIIITLIFRLHIDSIICYLIGSDNYIMCTASSIMLYYITYILYNFVAKFREEVYNIVRFLVKKYNENNKIHTFEITHYKLKILIAFFRN